MKTLVLDPEEVRAALDQKEHPRRCVWVVSMHGEIIVNDLDTGWVSFIPARGVTNKQWATAIKSAVASLQSKLEETLATYYRFLEMTDPAVPSKLLRLGDDNPQTIREGVTIPINRAKLERRIRYADMPTAPGTTTCPVCFIAIVSQDHKPYCSPICETEEAGEGTRVNIPNPFYVKKD